MYVEETLFITASLSNILRFCILWVKVVNITNLIFVEVLVHGMSSFHSGVDEDTLGQRFYVSILCSACRFLL